METARLVTRLEVGPRGVHMKDYITTARGRVVRARVGGGTRGKVTGFSRQSRMRLFKVMSGIALGGDVRFLTLTVGRQWEWEEAAGWFEQWRRKVQKRYPWLGFIWRREAQERGAPHWHLIGWGWRKRGENICGIWHSILKRNGWSGSAPEAILRRSATLLPVAKLTEGGVMSYVGKYIGKLSSQGEGRAWGFVSRKNIPFQTKVMHVDARALEEALQGNEKGDTLENVGTLVFRSPEGLAQRIQEAGEMVWEMEKNGIFRIRRVGNSVLQRQKALWEAPVDGWERHDWCASVRYPADGRRRKRGDRSGGWDCASGNAERKSGVWERWSDLLSSPEGCSLSHES